MIPAFDWTNQGEISTVDRSRGVTVRWTGGDPNGYTLITGIGFFYPSPNLGVASTFTCSERISAGRFTVPPVVLLSLPVSGSTFGVVVPGGLTVSSFSPAARFQASSLDLGVALSSVAISKNAFFQ